MPAKTEGHTIKRFDQELAHVQGLMMKMGGMVEDQVLQAIDALRNEDLEAAERVVERDHAINALDVKADEEIVNILALRQPVGGDLRLIMSIAKAITDLERIGDEAEKIGRMTVHMCNTTQGTPKKRLLRDVRSIGKLASRMVHDSLDAFARLDLEKAVATAEGDTELDSEFQAALRRLVTYIMEDPRTLGHAIHIIWIIKALERVGDHAKNIAEYVVYLVQGKDVRHIDVQVLAADVLNEE